MRTSRDQQVSEDLFFFSAQTGLLSVFVQLSGFCWSSGVQTRIWLNLMKVLLLQSTWSLRPDPVFWYWSFVLYELVFDPLGKTCLWNRFPQVCLGLIVLGSTSQLVWIVLGSLLDGVWLFKALFCHQVEIFLVPSNWDLIWYLVPESVRVQLGTSYFSMSINYFESLSDQVS